MFGGGPGDRPALEPVKTAGYAVAAGAPLLVSAGLATLSSLVLGGDKDGPDFPERAKHIADTIPGGELALLPGLGHVPHIQAPEGFNAALLKFLREGAPAAATHTSAAK